MQSYVENPKEIAFFSHFVRNLVLEYRPMLELVSIDESLLSSI